MREGRQDIGKQLAGKNKIEGQSHVSLSVEKFYFRHTEDWPADEERMAGGDGELSQVCDIKMLGGAGWEHITHVLLSLQFIKTQPRSIWK